MTKSPRIIKKYPNRRLYDTEISSYITVDEVQFRPRDGRMPAAIGSRGRSPAWAP